MGSSSKTTTSKNTPWAPAQPFITGAMDSAKTANDQGSALINQNQTGINAALSKLTNNVTNPDPYQADARTQLDKTINGDYVNANPYSSGLADLISQKTGAQYNSTFGAAGRSGGGLAALLSAQGTGDALQQFYSNQYNTERGNQMQAIGMAPAFNADEATASNALINGVGAASMQPGQVAGQYGNTITGLTSPYVQNVTTEKTKPSLMSTIATGVGLAAQIGGAVATGGTSLAAGGLGGGGGLGGLIGSGGAGFSALTPKPSFLG